MLLCPECDTELWDLDCDCGEDPLCDHCMGSGTVNDYLECTDCGETYHISDIEDTP